MERSVKNNILTVLTGALTGLVNGFFGGGGGMIVVPMMMFLLKYKTKVAHATAIAVILPVTLISVIVYLVKGKLGLELGIPVSIGVTLGGVFGAWLLGRLKPVLITRIFAVAMLAAGVKMLFF